MTHRAEPHVHNTCIRLRRLLQWAPLRPTAPAPSPAVLSDIKVLHKVFKTLQQQVLIPKPNSGQQFSECYSKRPRGTALSGYSSPRAHMGNTDLYKGFKAMMSRIVLTISAVRACKHKKDLMRKTGKGRGLSTNTTFPNFLTLRAQKCSPWPLISSAVLKCCLCCSSYSS